MISSIECFQLKTTQSINRLARSETNGEPNGNGMMQKGKGMKSAEGKKTKFHSGRNPALRSPIDWHRGDRWLADGCFRSTRRAKANAGFWLVGSVIGIDLPCWRWPAKKTRGFVSGFPVSIRRARAKAAFWLVGFFFRTGRCGANDEPFEKRRDRCKRVLLGILLGLLALLAAWVALGSRPPCLPLRRPPLLGSRPTTDDSRSIFFLVSPFPFVAYCFSWKRFTGWRTKPNYRLKDGFFFHHRWFGPFLFGFFLWWPRRWGCGKVQWLAEMNRFWMNSIALQIRRHLRLRVEPQRPGRHRRAARGAAQRRLRHQRLLQRHSQGKSTTENPLKTHRNPISIQRNLPKLEKTTDKTRRGVLKPDKTR